MSPPRGTASVSSRIKGKCRVPSSGFLACRVLEFLGLQVFRVVGFLGILGWILGLQVFSVVGFSGILGW